MRKLTIVGMIALLAVVVLAAGCVSKATGGGWFISDSSSTNPGDKVTFGFNVNVDKDGNAKGQMQLVDHETGQKVHIEEMNLIVPVPNEVPPDSAFFGGLDKDGVQVFVLVTDTGEPGPSKGDSIAVWYGTTPFLNPPTWEGTIDGGNIQTH